LDISTIGKKIDDIQVEISYKIIQLFSAGLYSSPNKAFEELVCNSYDAFADAVSVYIPSDLSAEGAYIWICDNGEGLNSIELKDLWRIGESSKRINAGRDKKRLQIGQFGIGKLATYVLARKLTYLSKKEGRYILATMDYDRIHGDVKNLSIDEREIDESLAISLLSYYMKPYKNGKLEFELFGENASATWTVSILTDLRPKVQEISEGRLKWILRTALPLNPQFNLYYNGDKIESSKIDVPVLKEWIIGFDDKTANTFKGAVCRQENTDYFVDFENLKGVNGRFMLYKDSLVSGKSSELGRSHGIFLNIRGRLINLDDPLLGMEAFSHGAFNRTRIIINADELDNNLTSTREAVKASPPYEQLKAYIKRKFNNEVKTYYFDEENREADKRTVSYRLSQTSYTTSKRPIYNFAKRFFAGEIVNPFLIEKPDISQQQNILLAYEKDIDTGSQVIETVIWAPLATGAPIAKLNLEKRLLTINSIHPYIANYADAYQNTLPLQSIAITEVLTEAHLYELGIDEHQINEVMRKRDTTLRELALADRDGIPAVALLLKEAIANPTGLEEAVYRVLLALGFEAVKIGGNGRPDGKAEARLAYSIDGKSTNYSLTYDAKSTGKDRIAAGTAHLAGLKRHQSDYSADFSLEVAIGYQGEDDPESAISKETKQQKVTTITVRDLIRLLFLATPKQLGLDKLRNLFETCHSPLEVKEWIDALENEKVDIPPYYKIIDLIYEIQISDNEPPTMSVIRRELNSKLGTSFSTPQVESFIRILQSWVPGLVSLEGDHVGVQAKADTIKHRISQVINTDVPPEARAMFSELFKN
jgi:hypothetical protein